MNPRSTHALARHTYLRYYSHVTIDGKLWVHTSNLIPARRVVEIVYSVRCDAASIANRLEREYILVPRKYVAYETQDYDDFAVPNNAVYPATWRYRSTVEYRYSWLDKNNFVNSRRKILLTAILVAGIIALRSPIGIRCICRWNFNRWRTKYW